MKLMMDIFFSNKKEINGIGISNTNSYNTNAYDNSFILYMNFKMNGASYDYYQRNFIKH